MNKYEIIEYVAAQYGCDAEYPWIKDPESAVLRHKGNNKWFGLIMSITADKLGLNSNDKIEILNTKCDPELIESMRDGFKYFKAYHMNRTHWMTILLNNVTNAREVFDLLGLSYELTK